jgi:hypothetical protein
MDNKVDHIVYLDNLQRLILAERISETTESINIKNPIILHVQNQGDKVNIQFFPVIFQEFLADRNAATTWVLYKKNITLCENPLLDARVVGQYKHIFSPKAQLPMVMQGTPPQHPMNAGQGLPPNTPTIKLFDD